jgi:hypothetical protein
VVTTGTPLTAAAVDQRVTRSGPLIAHHLQRQTRTPWPGGSARVGYLVQSPGRKNPQPRLTIAPPAAHPTEPAE